ncbi:MAG: hypothetical protein ACFFCW_00220 [Candidatus Hodarchaeota archaeon]
MINHVNAIGQTVIKIGANVPKKRTMANLYIKSHRYTTPDFRENYERTFKDAVRKQEEEGKEGQKPAGAQIKEEMKKGPIYGHFF